MRAAARPGFCDGIGFVFSATDPFAGLDLDHVWESPAHNGEKPAPWAIEILSRFRDTYREVSPSGTGIKVWCRATPPRCGKWPVEGAGGGGVEIYSQKRFFAVTTQSARTRTIADHQQDIEELIARLDEERRQSRSQGSSSTVLVPDVIPEGQRHLTLCSLAGKLWRSGLPAPTIERVLVITDEMQCDPPSGAEHVRDIVKNMQRWAR
jgi:primase-polymerase (primpol)-like protein